MKLANTHTTAESWLIAATNELRPYFAKFGYNLPEKIRYSIAFTSTGKRGTIPGECWHPESSEDGYYKIIIRADLSNPVDVLGVLVHELVHALLPPDAKHGKKFRDIALRIGLEGEMRHAYPAPLLKERLQVIANNLGVLPHGKLNFIKVSDAPKKQRTRHHKAECSVCGYSVQITAKWVRIGLPVCPADSKHGLLACDVSDDEDTETMSDNSSIHNSHDGGVIVVPAAAQNGKRKSKSVPDASVELFNPPA